MKYYIYISTSKIDMLFQQIPISILEKICAELNLNLGIISLTIKSKEDIEGSKMEKLKIVIKYIEKNFKVGSPDQPTEYFKGYITNELGTIW